MPLEHAPGKEAFDRNVKTLMGEVGKSPHVKSREQALAVAYSLARRAKGKAFGGSMGMTPGNTPMMPPSNAFLGGLGANQAPAMGPPVNMGVATPNAGMTQMGTPPIPTPPMGMPPVGVPQLGATQPTLPRTMAQGGVANLATGGFNMAKGPETNADWQTKREASSLTRGPIFSGVPGRTDAHATHVPSGSYVVPADIVSGRGQGNTIAGANNLQRLFKMGPYGSGGASMVHGAGVPRAAMPHAMHMAAPPSMHMTMPHASMHATAPPHLNMAMPHPMHMAAPPKMGKLHSGGGKSDDNIGTPVRVNLAGGELVIPPEHVLETVHRITGKGYTLKQAHSILDAWVLHERANLRKTLAKLPGPVKD